MPDYQHAEPARYQAIPAIPAVLIFKAAL